VGLVKILEGATESTSLFASISAFGDTYINVSGYESKF
jgi:hypothetical protein